MLLVLKRFIEFHAGFEEAAKAWDNTVKQGARWDP